MNTEDDYYDGDMSDSEYRQRIRREEESDRYYAHQRELHKQKQATSRVYYSPAEDQDSGSMW
jgi:hypothetical protein